MTRHCFYCPFVSLIHGFFFFLLDVTAAVGTLRTATTSSLGGVWGITGVFGLGGCCFFSCMGVCVCVCVSLFSLHGAGMGISLDKSQSQISSSHFLLLRHERGQTLREMAVWDKRWCVWEDADGAADPESAVPSAGNYLRRTAASISALCSFCIVCATTNSVRRSWLSGCSSQSTFHSSGLPTYHPSKPTPHTSSLLPCCPPLP